MKSVFNLNLVSAGVLLALGSLVGTAHAAGTTANTSVTNKATLDYTVGGVNQTDIASSPTGSTNGTGADTSFTVDNKVNLLVVAADSTFVPVVPGGSSVAKFTVTNTGNSTQDFSLSTASIANGAVLFGGTDNIDPSAACSVVVENDAFAVGNTYTSGTDTATFIDELAPDASKTVYVICSFAGTVVNKDVSLISLTATARTGGSAGGSVGAALTQTTTPTAGVDIVFADGAGSETADVARDASYSARDAFRVETAELQVTKTVATLCDPLNGNTNPKNIPGAFVQYTITILNKPTGLAPATLAVLTDNLVASLAFDPDLIAGASAAACVTGGTATSAAGAGFELSKGGATNGRASLTAVSYKTSAADTDGAAAAGQAVTLDFGTLLPAEGTYTAGQLKAGETVQVKFNTKIN